MTKNVIIYSRFAIFRNFYVPYLSQSRNCSCLPLKSFKTMTCNINPSVKTQNKPSNSRKTQLRDNFHQQSTYPRAPEIKPKFDLQAKQGQRKKTRQSKAKIVLKTRTYSKSEYTRDNNDKRDGKVHANDWICNKWSPRIGPIGRTHRVLATGQMDELGANPRIDISTHAPLHEAFSRRKIFPSTCDP